MGSKTIAVCDRCGREEPCSAGWFGPVGPDGWVQIQSKAGWFLVCSVNCGVAVLRAPPVKAQEESADG